MKKVRGKREEVRGEERTAKAEEKYYSDYFEHAFVKGCSPREFLEGYCQIENLRKTFPTFSPFGLALGHALRELREIAFNDIKLFLRNSDEHTSSSSPAKSEPKKSSTPRRDLPSVEDIEDRNREVRQVVAASARRSQAAS